MAAAVSKTPVAQRHPIGKIRLCSRHNQQFRRIGRRNGQIRRGRPHRLRNRVFELCTARHLNSAVGINQQIRRTWPRTQPPHAGERHRVIQRNAGCGIGIHGVVHAFGHIPQRRFAFGKRINQQPQYAVWSGLNIRRQSRCQQPLFQVSNNGRPDFR